MKRAVRGFFLLLTLAGSGLVTSPASRAASLPPAGVVPALLAQPAPATSQRHEEVFDWINLAILIAVLAYFLRRPLGQFFSQRAGSIRKSLEEGRKALEAAQAQLAAAEDKLRRLEQDIAALKESAAREMAAERDRLRKAGEEETERILESARSTIHSATQAAKLELRVYAAQQASELAEKLIQERLNEDSRTRLVTRFLQGIASRQDGKPEA